MSSLPKLVERYESLIKDYAKQITQLTNPFNPVKRYKPRLKECAQDLAQQLGINLEQVEADRMNRSWIGSWYMEPYFCVPIGLDEAIEGSRLDGATEKVYLGYAFGRVNWLGLPFEFVEVLAPPLATRIIRNPLVPNKDLVKILEDPDIRLNRIPKHWATGFYLNLESNGIYFGKVSHEALTNIWVKKIS